ncbi:hypothetical protein HDE_12598 [Halotydeus destructor]|nr:hypothetical protein HDE_12598 [Halotydeus destructor]
MATNLFDALSHLVWSVIWIAVLAVIGLPVAVVCGVIYIVTSIFSPCLAGLKPIEDMTLQGLNLPRTCARNALHGESYLKLSSGKGGKVL